MASINFNTTNQTFRQLFGSDISYVVPRFQRNYTWSEEHWDDIWHDFIGLFNEEREPFHYMGYLVLQSDDNKTFTIIDGQQRITTISLIILAILKLIGELVEKEIESENNKKRIDHFRNSFIGFLDPVTLVSQSKLKLNRNNDDFYQNYIVPLHKLPMRGLKVSDKLLKKCFEWFYSKLNNYFKKKKDGAEFAKFIDELSDKLVFTIITVGDELNAFKVFETLNARGVKLSSTDLLKNYLFSVVSNNGAQESIEIDNLENRWQNIISKLGAEDFPTFLRIFWNSYNPLARKSDLFKTIRNNIKNKKDVFELIRKIDTAVDIYIALKNPDDELWQNEVQSKYIKFLKLFNVRQPFSMLISAYNRLQDKDFTKLLKYVFIISFRYNVIGGLNPNEQENIYNKAALKISKERSVNFQEVLNLLKAIYVNDSSFKASFSYKTIRTSSSRNKRIVKHILFSLEKHISNKDFDFESEKYSIEHIFPENPDEGWEEFTDDQFTYRLGNFTLLTKSENREVGNKCFDEKKIVYQKNAFEITKRIYSEYSNWNENNINKHQRWMANQASSIWRIPNI